MDHFVIYLVDFDIRSGPEILTSIGGLQLTDDQIQSLKSCSFPDSMSKNPPDNLFFVFTVGKYYCYTLFSTVQDASAPRGHKMLSCVICTLFPFVYPFLRLLFTTKSFGGVHDPNAMELISSFVQKWGVLTSEPTFDLPTFEGPIRVNTVSSNAQLMTSVGGFYYDLQIDPYIPNNHFLDIDLSDSLNVQFLYQSGRTGDLLYLWESLILNEPILVYGIDPPAASAAVLAISSFSFPDFPKQEILPFVTSTDPRFQNLFKPNQPSMIVGTSNPIVLQSKFRVVYRIGFEVDGLSLQKRSWPSIDNLEEINSMTMRRVIYENSLRLTLAIQNCFHQDPYSPISLKNLVQQLSQQEVQFIISPTAFAQRIFELGTIQEKRPKMIEGSLRLFDCAKFILDFNEVQLVDLYAAVESTKKEFDLNQSIVGFCDRDLFVIKRKLSPNLAFVS